MILFKGNALQATVASWAILCYLDYLIENTFLNYNTNFI